LRGCSGDGITGLAVDPGAAPLAKLTIKPLALTVARRHIPTNMPIQLS
jgi:hypothetical protein